MENNKEQTTKEKKKLPYRFTCPIIVETTGEKVVFTEEQEKEIKKIKEELYKQFNIID